MLLRRPTFVIKQKQAKVDLETKVSKDFLSASPLEIRNHYRRRGKLTDRKLRIAAADFRGQNILLPSICA